MLASPHYGERMAADWLDIARFADTNGYQNDFNRSMWPWRDWVINAFNANMRADQFLIEQVAGDLLPEPSTSQLVATGFNRNHRMVTEGGSIDEEWRVENVVDRVETTSTAFLGLTMGCARCHDHKYDPLSRRDFYRFYAFFNNVDEQGVYTERRGNVPPLISLPTPEQTEQLTELERSLAEASARLTEAKAAAEAKSADVTPTSDAAEPGATVTPAGDAAEAAAEEGNPDADEPQALVAERQAEVDQLTKQRNDLNAAIQTTMIMRERQEVRPTYLLRRGQYDQPDESEVLGPQVPELFGTLADDAAANRLGLAEWLTSPANPLTARVMVNRIWQQMFGRGLVATPNNFGVQGDLPSHPALLDWLAVQFVESGWDVKALQRAIALSATYRQTGADDVTALLAHGGSPIPEDRRTPDLAALTAVATVILNLDETVSR